MNNTESLKYWVQEISSESLSHHWQIAAVIQPFLIFDVLPGDLEIQLYPLLKILSEGGKSLRHKANVARFALDIIIKYQEREAWIKSSENFFL